MSLTCLSMQGSETFEIDEASHSVRGATDVLGRFVVHHEALNVCDYVYLNDFFLFPSRFIVDWTYLAG